MYYLSIDVANKSLAINFIKYIKPKQILVDKITTVNELKELNNKINEVITFYICEVIDLLPNKKVKNTTIIERANALKIYIKNLNLRINKIIDELDISKIKLLIELQPSFNDKSRATFNQLIYEFSDNNIYKIKIMNASYKNTIYLHKDLKHSNFIKKYSNNYLANKNHTKENFIYFLKQFNLMHLLKKIKKKNYDDIADSFMQVLAYIYKLEK